MAPPTTTPPQLHIPQRHYPVTPSPSTSSDGSSRVGGASPSSPANAFIKPRFFSWRVLGGIFATMLVVGWVFIIVILIQEEKWQLVLIAWLLLYAAAHFCYWYFKSHHLFSIQSQICGRTRGNVRSLRRSTEKGDAPPSYEDILKSEAPPPTYYTAVEGVGPLSKFDKQSTYTIGFPHFSLPKVFGRGGNTSPSLPSSASSSTTPNQFSAPAPSTSGARGPRLIPKTLKKGHRGKSSCYPFPHDSASTAPPTNGALGCPTTHTQPWKLPPSSYAGVPETAPPSYSDSLDDESKIIASSEFTRTPPLPSTSSSPPPPTFRRPRTKSVSKGADDTIMNEALRPIFSPILKNTSTALKSPAYSSNSPSSSTSSSRPTTSRGTSSAISVHVDVEREKHCSTPIST